MIKKSILPLLFFTIQLQAQGIDQGYYSQDNETWGEKFQRILHLPNSKGFNKSYALVIGVGKYKDSSFPALGASKDAMKVKNYLINEAGFDYVHLLTDEKVTVKRIRQLMVETMPSKIGKNDRFLFFWSGHGETRNINSENQGYLPVYSTRKNRYSNMISMKNLKQWDSLLEGKQALYLLDSCFSGLAGFQPQSSHNELTIEQLARKSSTLITAGSANEKTFNLHGSSIFATALLDGLRGEADTANGRYKKDGIISRSELLNYLRNRISWEKEAIKWKTSITPQISNFQYSQGEFFFFNNNTTTSNSITPTAYNSGTTTSQSSSSSQGSCTKQITVPAVYKTVTEKVLEEEGGIKYVKIPAKFKKVIKRVLSSNAYKKYIWIDRDGTQKILEEPFKVIKERALISKGFKDFTIITDNYGKEKVKTISPLPKYVTITRKEYRAIDLSKLPQDLNYKVINVPGKYKTITIKELVTKARVEKKYIPDRYKTITKKIKVQDSYTKTVQTACN